MGKTTIEEDEITVHCSVSGLSKFLEPVRDLLQGLNFGSPDGCDRKTVAELMDFAQLCMAISAELGNISYNILSSIHSRLVYKQPVSISEK